ncbi:hypothetical protein V8E54_007984 [Elaphomyces granulatus]
MHSLVQAQWEGAPHTQWVLHRDPSCATQTEPWGIEVISPLLRSHPGSTWRNDVRALWGFLSQRYNVSGNANCSTHVHVSRAEDFTPSELKCIAQAIIHFEPAFEVLVPPERRGNRYSRSSWIDNPHLACRNLSRDQSIDLIESLNTVDQIIEVMNPDLSKYFGWNFLPIRTLKTIEFRRGSVSLTSDDTFMWVELAMSFIKAASIQNSPQQLRQYPRTTGGLKAFIQNAYLPTQPGTHGSSYLDLIFHGKDSSARLEPRPVSNLFPWEEVEEEAKLYEKYL